MSNLKILLLLKNNSNFYCNLKLLSFFCLIFQFNYYISKNNSIIIFIYNYNDLVFLIDYWEKYYPTYLDNIICYNPRQNNIFFFRKLFFKQNKNFFFKQKYWLDLLLNNSIFTNQLSYFFSLKWHLSIK